MPLRAAVFGASGMVGQGLIRECLRNPEIGSVISIVRARGSLSHPKLREIVHPDFEDFTSAEPALAECDACFYCVGISANGTPPAEYRRVTVDVAAAAARSMARARAGAVFVFVSAAGADNTGRSSMRWARVKGESENLVRGLPLRVTVVRPAMIVPLHGIKSRTRLYRIFYSLIRPLIPLLRALAPGHVVTTSELARVIIGIAVAGSPKSIVESRDFRALHRNQAAAATGGTAGTGATPGA